MNGVAKGDELATVKLHNHHLSILVWPEGGRILEVASLRSGRQLVSWWPFKLDDPDRVGGIGESLAGAGPCSVSQSAGSITMSRELQGDLRLEKTITLPPDALVFHVSLALHNHSDRFQTYDLREMIAASPGSGGACPRAESGILGCHDLAFLKRPDEPARELTYEVFETVRAEHDDLEWAAFVDPVSDNLFSVILPAGHTVLRSEYHWWLEWSKVVELAPGASFTTEFHFAATAAMRLPILAGEHLLGGYAGKLATLEPVNRGVIQVYALDTPGAKSAASVSLDGREFASDKVLGDSREPLVITLPEWSIDRDLEIELAVGGKYGRARISNGRVVSEYRRLESICDAARTAHAKGVISARKAASVAALKRIVDLNLGKSAPALETIIKKAADSAAAILNSPLDAVPFYSEAEEKVRARIAASLDLDAAAEHAREALAEAYDLSIPRFRQAGRGAFALKDALLEAALLISVRHDDEVIELFRTRLGELRDLWVRHGEIVYETIHHGVILCSIIPAYEIASAAGYLSAEEEADTQAFIFDLAAKIRRQGGRQFRLSNWHAMEDAALAYVGALFPYLPESRDYLEKARQTLYWLLVHGTLSDGGFWEMAPSYHMVTLEYLWHIWEALKRAGEDCYAGDVCGRKLSDMTAFFKTIAVPPGRVPALDDSGRNVRAGLLLSLAKRFSDGELAFHADAAFERQGQERGMWETLVPALTPAPTAPNRGSEMLQGSGKLVLRSSSRLVTMVLEYGPHGGWHGHNDKLTYELFQRDKCLVPDAGSYKYEDALHWSWFKTAAAHNTVTLGDRDQLPCRGRLLYFNESRDCVTAAVEARTYEHVTHRREVTISDRTIIVDDFIDGAAGETLVWRMNSFTPISIEGGGATLARDGISARIESRSEGVRFAVAEVPLVGENEGAGEVLVKGWQLRISKPASHDAERILVRIDLSW